ncbi:MAG: histidine kinase [Spirochaetales bacterium]|nr:histidine kinase [Spirochaetales bacterium]
MLTLAFVSVLGIFLGIFFSTRSVFGELKSVESKYENLVIKKYADDLNEFLGRLNDLYLNIYLEDFMGFTIENLLNGTFSNINEEQKEGLLTGKLQLINRIYPKISELILVEYDPYKIYTFTLLNGRDIRLDYNFERTTLLQSLKKRGNRKLIISPSFPDYIYSRTEETTYPVITIGMNIFDNRFYNSEEPTGSLIININPEKLQDLAKDIDSSFPGRFVICIDSDSLLVDSGIDYRIQHPAGNLSSVQDGPVKKIPLIWDELTLIHIPDQSYLMQLYWKNRLLIIIIMSLISVIMLMVSILMNRLINQRLNPLVASMEKTMHGDFNSIIKITHTDEFSFLEEAYNRMCTTLEAYIERVYKVELQYHSSQLKLLKQQFNPHFMYNTLQSIQMKALINNDVETSRMVQILGDIFRWALKESSEVSLGEELHYLSKYVELQSCRYPRQLRLDVSIPDALKPVRVLKMIFQPLLENAISHGLANQDKDGVLKLSVHEEGDTLLFGIDDNGQGLSVEQRQQLLSGLQSDESAGEEHIGLVNLHQRIVKYYERSDLGIRDIRDNGNGTTVVLALPSHFTEKTV